MVEQKLSRMGIKLTRLKAPRPARPQLADYMVAQRPPSGDWPPEAEPNIKRARELYDAGTHELVTAMSPERWSQLYCVPRKKPAEPRCFFAEQAA